MARAARTAADRELAALSAIMNALQGLDGESIQRVLDYVFSRLSIAAPRGGTHMSLATAGTQSPVEAPVEGAPRKRLNIRDLAAEKRPESSNQMAALVAYYLSEVADEDERKRAINSEDIGKYFKQAGFRLPRAQRSALPNAAAAGYFDAVGRGQYKLNAVGYNLVAHGLPRQGSDRDQPRRRAKRRSQSGKPRPRSRKSARKN